MTFRSLRRPGCQLVYLFILLVAGMVAASAAPHGRIVQASGTRLQQLAPDFALTDSRGKLHHLSEFRSKPVALFFFCGCPWCQQCAQTWGQFQRGGALPLALPASLTSASPSTPLTLIIFSGDKAAARTFETQAGLDPAQTLLLPDPDLRVTAAYHADPCPRAFVLDAGGRVSYTNDHPDDTPRQASALAIASRTLDALRICSAPSPGVGKPAAPLPDLVLPVVAMNDKLLGLAAQPGWKVIYFWSSTCPCVRACESFTFTPLARHYQGKVAFFAVVSNGYDLQLPQSQLAHQVKQRHLPFPVLLDDKHQVALALDAKVTPQAFLLDPQNHVVFAGIPDDSRRYQARTGTWGVSQSYLARAIKEALSGKHVTTPRVKDEGCIIAW